VDNPKAVLLRMVAQRYGHAQDEAIMVNETKENGTMSRRPNIDVKVLAALENSGVERVKLEVMRMTGTNLFAFCDVKVTRGDALDWLTWKGYQKARWDRVIALITMVAAIVAAAPISMPSFKLLWRTMGSYL
jgi:hypothetical protein